MSKSKNEVTEAYLMTMLMVVLTLVFTYQVVMENSTKDWMETDADVLKIEVYRQGSDDVETVARVRAVRTHRSSPDYCLKVTYEYNMDGQIFIGDQYSAISDDRCPSSSSKRDALVSDVKEADSTGDFKVYVNPEDPSESVIEKGVQTDTWIIFWICLIFTAIFGLYLRNEKIKAKNTEENDESSTEVTFPRL